MQLIIYLVLALISPSQIPERTLDPPHTVRHDSVVWKDNVFRENACQRHAERSLGKIQTYNPDS